MTAEDTINLQKKRLISQSEKIKELREDLKRSSEERIELNNKLCNALEENIKIRDQNRKLDESLQESRRYRQKAESEVNQLREENERLKEWKRQQLEVWSPVLDYMQSDKSLSLGSSISKEVLRRCQSFKELKAKLDQAIAQIDKLINS